MALLALLSTVAMADVVVSNITVTTTVPMIVTNTTQIANAKLVWTSFMINYLPPAYTNAVYTISYFAQDPVTKKEIPSTRQTKRMTEKEVVTFAASLGVNFGDAAGGISGLINAWLLSQGK
jgi:hypothetical protein